MKTIEKSGQSSAITALEAITKQREEAINNVKMVLADALTNAANYYKLLKAEGLHTVLSEPQYREACEILGLAIPGQGPTNGDSRHMAKRPRVSNRKGVSFEDAIQRSLSDGKTRSVDDIYKKVQALKGADASRNTMLAVLSVVRKKGFIKPVARGQYAKV